MFSIQKGVQVVELRFLHMVAGLCTLEREELGKLGTPKHREWFMDLTWRSEGQLMSHWMDTAQDNISYLWIIPLKEVLDL